jgi:hypothetical protein
MGRSVRHNVSVDECGLFGVTHLLFAEEWKVEKDFDRFGVSSQYDEFSDTPVESFSGC